MPAAKLMAGVDMRLEAGGYRELHWHQAAEWALVLNGSCRIQARPNFITDRFCLTDTSQAVDENGRTFVDDVTEGDVWFFPPYVPTGVESSRTDRCSQWYPA